MNLRPLPQVIVTSLCLLLTTHASGQRRNWQPMPQTRPRAAPQSAPVIALPVTNFKLVSPGTGWASTGKKLLWTIDNGEHWRDITPLASILPNQKEGALSGIFFLGAEAGWALSAVESDGSSSDHSSGPWPDLYHIYLLSTVDAGASWTVVSEVPTSDAPGELTGSGLVAFSDRDHGWIDLGAFRGGVLLETSDGGKTWRRAPGDPEVGVDVVALSGRDAFFAGGPDDSLFVTHDGGAKIQEISLPLPPGIPPSYYPIYELPKFQTARDGYEVVNFRGPLGSSSAAGLYSTQDGGRTWRADRVITGLAEGEIIKSDVADSTWLIPFAPGGSKPTVLRLGPGAKITAPAQTSMSDFTRCHLSFIAPEEGWMVCSGNILSSNDGGATWMNISPRTRAGTLTSDPITPVPARSSVNAVPIKPAVPGTRALAAMNLSGSGTAATDEHLGFDSTSVLPVAAMQAWWNSSPYYDAGVYLPGSPNRSSNHDYPTSDWITAVEAQGWGLWPIWFGLQAPCANYHPTWMQVISSVENTAAQQGAEQADLAYDKATNLDLDGSIIYFDIEPYNTQNTACSAAVRAYVGSFVEEWHEDSAADGVVSSVGAYGDVWAVPGDFYNASPRPDDVWVANNSGHRATVWNLGAGGLLDPGLVKNANLTDNLWPNNERMHQYDIDVHKTQPVYETWGGAGPYEIDDDIVDAMIVPSTGVKQYTLNTPEVFGGAFWVSGGGANGANDGTTTYMGPAVGWDYGPSEGFVFSFSSPSGWPYATGETLMQDPPNSWPNNWAYNGGPASINNVGQIAGSYTDPDYSQNGFVHGFIYTPGSNGGYTSLDYPSSAPCSFLTSINDAGWVVGVWQDTSQDNQFCGNGLNPQHCILWKPPYDSPISFDYFGGAANCGQVNGVGSGPYVNGLGQFSGTAMSGQAIDVTFGVGSVFLDDVQSGTPGPADSNGNASVVIAATGSASFYAAGLNNNGEIAGTVQTGQWVTVGRFQEWQESDAGGVFINTDGSYLTFPSEDAGCGDVVSLDDEVQIMLDWSCYMDSQH